MPAVNSFSAWIVQNSHLLVAVQVLGWSKLCCWSTIGLVRHYLAAPKALERQFLKSPVCLFRPHSVKGHVTRYNI